MFYRFAAGYYLFSKKNKLNIDFGLLMKNAYGFGNNTPTPTISNQVISRNCQCNLDKTQFPGAGDSLAAGADIKFSEDVRDVALDRGQGNDQRRSDVFVAGSGGHEA
jgi:hypothetical protein